MQNINWDMMTQFVFPEELGLVEEVITCNIIPRWQQIETEDSIQLHGIYHITAVARFNPNELPQYSEGTLIEELEFDGNNGYFEYALPLNVDLPREKIAPDNKPELAVDNIQFLVYDGCSCTFKWEVNCSFEEPVQGALLNQESGNEPPIIDYRADEPQDLPKEIRFGHDAIFPEEPDFGDFPALNVTESIDAGQTIESAPVSHEGYPTPQEVGFDQTTAPEQKVAPIEDVAPTQQEEPVKEAVPTQQEEPVKEAVPTQQEEPVKEAVPTQQVEPVKEVVPVQQVTPVQNEAPTNQPSPLDEKTIQTIELQAETTESNSSYSEPSITQVHLNTFDESDNNILDLATDVVVNQGTIVKENSENQVTTKIEEPQKKEKIIHSNQYFPTDADDFYNDLKESYTILNISNKIRNE